MSRSEGLAEADSVNAAVEPVGIVSWLGVKNKATASREVRETIGV